ncbi:hypothetical protein AMD27_10270 [Acinetobacter sp. TGL-Y2]|nr:hypothetical protein AMD27_10270 [Acinetobacter sp. TGL-Y2]
MNKKWYLKYFFASAASSLSFLFLIYSIVASPYADQHDDPCNFSLCFIFLKQKKPRIKRGFYIRYRVIN